MTKEEYKKLPKSDKKTLNDSLNIVAKFMTNKDDNRNEYKSILRNNIDNFFCKRTNKDKAEEILSHKENVVGICRTKSKRSFIHRFFKIYPTGTKFSSEISINDADSNNYKSNLMIAIHEVNHADTAQYNEVINGGFYSGLHKLYRKNLNTFCFIGEGLNECMNELYTQIQFFNECPDCYTNIFKVDDLIYKPYKPSFVKGIVPNGEQYRELTLIVKLLLIACDNDMMTTYHSLSNNGEKFIEKSVPLNNNNRLVKNDLIYAGKKNGKDFEEMFDKLSDQEGAFESLLKRLDYLLYQIKDKKEMDKTVLSDVIRTIDYYKNNKFDAMEQSGLWGKVRRSYSENKYNDYRSFLIKTYNLQPAIVTNIPTKTLTLNKKTGND